MGSDLEQGSPHARNLLVDRLLCVLLRDCPLPGWIAVGRSSSLGAFSSARDNFVHVRSITVHLFLSSRLFFPVVFGYPFLLFSFLFIVLSPFVSCSLHWIPWAPFLHSFSSSLQVFYACRSPLLRFSRFTRCAAYRVVCGLTLMFRQYRIHCT